jgi:hypothetical protein
LSGTKVFGDIVENTKLKFPKQLQRMFVARRNSRPDCGDAEVDEPIEHVSAERLSDAAALEGWKYGRIKKPPNATIVVHRNSTDHKTNDFRRDLREGKCGPTQIIILG